jgi:tryptophan 2,3-dioxygenase
MGNKNAAMLKPHAHHAEPLSVVQAAYEAPSLYDESLRLLARRGLAVASPHVERDWTQPTKRARRGAGLAAGVPRAAENWDLYQLGELTDWRRLPPLALPARGATVERVIGFKRGTGGGGRVSYLRKMLDVVLFPEIWQLRTEL